MSYEMNGQERVLNIFCKLLEGKTFNLEGAAADYGVDPRTIKRDIAQIRNVLCESDSMNFEGRDIVYDRKNNHYSMTGTGKLTASETLAVCKILIESRAFPKDKLDSIIGTVTSLCASDEKTRDVKALISNEKHHYTEPQHGKDVIDLLWKIGEAAKNQQTIEITYTKLSSDVPVVREVNPVGIIFSDYYFYMAAFINNIDKEKDYHDKDDVTPTVYRIDRLKSVKVTDKKFVVPYRDRFEEGEFRKRIQFMYSGRLLKIKLKCKNFALEALLDRLPTAQVIEKGDEYSIVRAEVFGRGIKRWILSQEDNLEVLEPQSLRDETKELLNRMIEIYDK